MSEPSAPALRDVDLLAIENDVVCPFDERGRRVGNYGLGIAVARDGYLVVLGSDVPDALATELEAAVADTPPAFDPTTAPRVLDGCRRLLEQSGGPVQQSGPNPSYLIPPDTRFSSGAEIIRSDDGNADELVRSLRGANPQPGGWTATEWDDLLDGTLGPWAMAMVDGRVVSICHTPRHLTERGAECGVWTHPDFRGRRHAPAVTAAWASVLAPTGRHLFYSTEADNRSSQRVAARLGLRVIGWSWTLARD
ncbi:MAG: GNAT family N-acetyltransferase [Acidimicrobiia bacterium]